MISDEDLDLVRASQKAITRLDGGSPIVSGSAEHQALRDAIIRLSNMILTRPISEKELEKIKKYCKESGIIQ